MDNKAIRKGRSLQACEACRKQKLACTMSDGGDCERCLRLKKTCTPHIAKVPGPRRPRQLKPQDSEGVLDTSELPNLVTRENLTTGMMPEQDWSKLMDVSDERHQKVDDFGKTLFESLGSFSVDGDISVLCKLSWQEADAFLDHYRTSLSPQWPFIIIPRSHSCRTLLERDKAPLLLAILAVASYSDGGLQLVCETVFRHFIAFKTFINCEQSLAILQSLLVFLAWHHYAYRPKMAELYRNCQVLVEHGMHDLVEKRSGQTQNNDHSLEVQRALLGCYYLSTHGLNVFGLNRAPTFLYCAYYSKCATALHQAHEEPEDVYFESMIDLLRIVERIHGWKSQLGQKSSSAAAGLDNSFASHISQELQAWGDKYMSSENQIEYVPAWLISAYRYTYVYLLDPMQPVTRALPRDSADFLPQLRACITAVEAYFDNFLHARMNDLAIMAIPEWVHVLSTLIIGIRMTMVLRTHGAQETSPSKIDRVLVEIIEHITRMLKGDGAPAMLFDWLRAIMQGLQRWLHREIPNHHMDGTDSYKSAYDTITNLSAAMKKKDPDYKWPPMGGDRGDLSTVMLLGSTAGSGGPERPQQAGDYPRVPQIPDSMEDVIFDGLIGNLLWSF